MTLKILLPFEVFAEKSEVLRIVAETPEGAFGLLPHRLDCIAALEPGILIYETAEEGEAFVAVDEGILVKVGDDVCISVRRAHGGDGLESLRTAAETEFLTLDESDKELRSVTSKLEMGFLRRFTNFQHER